MNTPANRGAGRLPPPPDPCDHYARPGALKRMWGQKQKGLVYMWAYTQRERVLSPAFIAREHLLSPDHYELVDVRTRSGVRRALLFPKAILQAEFAANREQRSYCA
jgi:hypothetical protein